MPQEFHPPITEAELQAHVDAALPPERDRDVQAWLRHRPEEAQRIAAYRSQRQALQASWAPLLDEPIPAHLLAAARRPVPQRPWRMLAAALACVTLGGLTGWQLRGSEAVPALPAEQGLAQRAAVAHVVYAPDRRRPVEVDAAHEDQLVAWLSKRIGTPVRAPHLQALGYTLEGGRLLPGERAPVAQFMYTDAAQHRLTLYVSTEARAADGTGFQFAQHGPVNVFYWVDGTFGYALTAEADRATLASVAGEVHRQLSR